MIGIRKILYVKLLTTKQPRTQVNKYHADVLIHKGGTLLMHENKLVPYILQNNRFYVPLIYAYHSFPHIISQAKRGARAPKQYEIDYLNLLFLYFSIDSLALTSDTLLVDAFSIKSPDLQPPIHYRTLHEHQQYERNRLLNTPVHLTQVNSHKPSNKTQQSTIKSSLSTNKSNKCLSSNVVVNPLIHHPSFYGLSSINSSTLNQSQLITKPISIQTIKHNNNHTLNAIVKSSIHDSKISIKHIFERFSFNINYERFIQWCQTNSLLSLVKLDQQEISIINENNNVNENDYYIYYRHLDRCIELLNDLKRGIISMTLLPSSNNESSLSQQQIGPIKSPLAGIMNMQSIKSFSNKAFNNFY